MPVTFSSQTVNPTSSGELPDNVWFNNYSYAPSMKWEVALDGSTYVFKCSGAQFVYSYYQYIQMAVEFSSGAVSRFRYKYKGEMFPGTGFEANPLDRFTHGYYDSHELSAPHPGSYPEGFYLGPGFSSPDTWIQSPWFEVGYDNWRFLYFYSKNTANWIMVKDIEWTTVPYLLTDMSDGELPDFLTYYSSSSNSFTVDVYNEYNSYYDPPIDFSVGTLNGPAHDGTVAACGVNHTHYSWTYTATESGVFSYWPEDTYMLLNDVVLISTSYYNYGDRAYVYLNEGDTLTSKSYNSSTWGGTNFWGFVMEPIGKLGTKTYSNRVGTAKLFPVKEGYLERMRDFHVGDVWGWDDSFGPLNSEDPWSYTSWESLVGHTGTTDWLFQSCEWYWGAGIRGQSIEPWTAEFGGVQDSSWYELFINYLQFNLAPYFPCTIKKLTLKFSNVILSPESPDNQFGIDFYTGYNNTIRYDYPINEYHYNYNGYYNCYDIRDFFTRFDVGGDEPVGSWHTSDFFDPDPTVMWSLDNTRAVREVELDLSKITVSPNGILILRAEPDEEALNKLNSNTRWLPDDYVFSDSSLGYASVFKGTWLPNTYYYSTSRHVVYYGGMFYQCRYSGKSGLDFNTDYDLGRWKPVPEWESGRPYAISQTVLYGGTIYHCYKMHISSTPPTNEHWCRYLLTVDYLRKPWATGTVYYVGDIVSLVSPVRNYYCQLTHTSSVWVDDLAANKWSYEPLGQLDLNYNNQDFEIDCFKDECQEGTVWLEMEYEKSVSGGTMFTGPITTNSFKTKNRYGR